MSVVRGVRSYVRATATVWFPDGKINCWNCMMFDRTRNRCVCSGESIQDPMQIGNYCELEFERSTEDEGIQTAEC